MRLRLAFYPSERRVFSTLSIVDPRDVFTLVVFVVMAAIVSVLMDVAAAPSLAPDPVDAAGRRASANEERATAGSPLESPILSGGGPE